MNSKTKNVLFTILLVVDIILLLAFGISKTLTTETNLTIINERFLETARTNYILKTISKNSLVTFVCVTIFIVGILKRDTEAEMEESKWKVISIFIIVGVIGLLFLINMINELIPAVLNESVVEAGVIEEKDYRYSKGLESYYLIINDNKIQVSEKEYNRAHQGDIYYVICCGDKVIKVCDPEKYTNIINPEIIPEPEE